MPLKGDNISERLMEFAVRVIRVSSALPKNQVAKHICGQLMRCGTSAGANYEEARGAESRNDFTHKLGVCLKELRESLYWLNVIQKAGLLPAAKLAEIIKEADELSRIIAKSIQSTRNNNGRSASLADNPAIIAQDSRV